MTKTLEPQRRSAGVKQASADRFATLDELQAQLDDVRAELQRSAETVQNILDAASDAFLFVDESGVVRDWSRRAEQLFGWTREQALGRPLRETILPQVGGDNALLALMGENDAGGRASTTVSCHNGQELPVEFSISPIEQDGELAYMAFAHDIRSRQSMQAQLAHAQKMESVGQLAAGIAHEINTPIQYVGDNVRFLQEGFQDILRVLEMSSELANSLPADSPLGSLACRVLEASAEVDVDFLREEVPSAIAQAIEGTQRVAQIVRAMKEFSHPGGKEKVSVNINQAIESTTLVCRNEWKYVATLELELDPTLPMAPCLPGEFNQTILNLVVNAAHAVSDHSGTAGAKGTITVQTSAEPEWIVVRVRDTGCGIKPDHLPRIFDPFFTTKPAGRGTGQGLAIAYAAIVDKHQGRIDVESEVGVGTTFTVRLPRS